MQVVILAGGKGTRLRPLTYKIPKVMVPIKGKVFLEYLIELLKKNNLKEILLCIGYLGEQIKNYFGDGKKWGVKIKYSSDGDKLLGTGGALKNAENLLKSEFIVINGDTFLNIDYQDLISFFHQKNKLGVMVVFKNRSKIIPNNVKINKNNQIIFYNKKGDRRANGIDAGVQIFKKKILSLIKANEKVSLEEDIFPMLIKRQELIAYPIKQRFYDIGTLKGLKIFNQIL